MAQLKLPTFIKKIRKLKSNFPNLAEELESCKTSKNSPEIIANRGCGFLGTNELTRLVKKTKYLGDISSHDAECKMAYSVMTWEYTKNIYSFDDTLLKEVITTTVEKLPAELLLDMPDWTVYISCPNLHEYIELPLRINGFFATILFNELTGSAVCCFITQDLKDNIPLNNICMASETITFPNNTIDIRQSIEANRQQILNDPNINLQIKQLIERSTPEYLQKLFEQNVNVTNALLSMLLYICSQKQEITGKSRHNNKPAVRQVKNKFIINKAEQLNYWDVGVRLGQAIRKYQQSEQNRPKTLNRHASPRPHVRKAHWQLYWTGSRKDETKRKPLLKWLAPILVNAESKDDLPITIKKVKK